MMTLPRRHPLARFCLALLLLLPLPALAAAPEDRSGDDRWYALRLQGEPAGWMRESERVEAGRVVSEEALRLSLRRGEETVSLELGGSFVETADGTLLEAESRQSPGLREVVRRLRFGGGEVEITLVEGGRETTSRRPAPPGRWLAPAAAKRFVRGEVARGAREVRYLTLDVTGDLAGALEPVEVVMRWAGREPLEVAGRVVPAIAWDVELSQAPGVPVREHTDEGGRSLCQVFEFLPGLPLTAELADRDLAIASARPVEILGATLVVPEGRLASPRSLRRASYELRAAGRSWGGPAETSVQRVAPLGPGSWRATVDLDAPRVGADAPGEDHLRPSTYVGSDDPEVRRLAADALAGRPLPEAEAAEALRRFVRRFVHTKDLSVGLATAGEVARTGQGDCTEHAVLLAALLRARGIPSRVVSGLVYLDRYLGREGVFGYHMWTQAWLAPSGGPGRWVDLDAALDDTPFDAAHLALSASALADGAFTNDLVRLAPVLGRLTVRVEAPAAP